MNDLEVVTFHLQYFNENDELTEKRTIEIPAGSRALTKYLFKDKAKRAGYVDFYEHRKDCKDECWLGRRELSETLWHDKYGWHD